MVIDGKVYEIKRVQHNRDIGMDEIIYMLDENLSEKVDGLV